MFQWWEQSFFFFFFFPRSYIYLMNLHFPFVRSCCRYKGFKISSKSNNLQHLHNNNSLSCYCPNVRHVGQPTPEQLVKLYLCIRRLLSFFSCSRVHGHVLQRAVRQVRHATAVRLLSILGPQLGVQEERHHGGNHQL